MIDRRKNSFMKAVFRTSSMERRVAVANGRPSAQQRPRTKETISHVGAQFQVQAVFSLFGNFDNCLENIYFPYHISRKLCDSSFQLMRVKSRLELLAYPWHDRNMMTERAKQAVMPTDFRLPRPLVLVGLMGAGKTSIGKRLAVRLGVDFVDADAQIELAAGCRVADIFEVWGEAAFRDGERKVIARLLTGSPKILATGGGAFMDAQTREHIAVKALSVWLKADLDVLLERTSRNDRRPLLNTGDPRETLSRLMDLRYPVYAKADITVVSDDQPHDEIVDRVLAALTDYWLACGELT